MRIRFPISRLRGTPGPTWSQSDVYELAAAIPRDRDAQPQIPRPRGPAPTTLLVQDLVMGSGPEAKRGDYITLDYVGVYWATGEEFDSSWKHGRAFSFSLGVGHVLVGWDRGLIGMKVGGRRLLVVPPDLGPLSPGSRQLKDTLAFVIDLRAIGSRSGLGKDEELTADDELAADEESERAERFSSDERLGATTLPRATIAAGLAVTLVAAFGAATLAFGRAPTGAEARVVGIAWLATLAAVEIPALTAHALYHDRGRPRRLLTARHRRPTGQRLYAFRHDDELDGTLEELCEKLDLLEAEVWIEADGVLSCAASTRNPSMLAERAVFLMGFAVASGDYDLEKGASSADDAYAQADEEPDEPFPWPVRIPAGTAHSLGDGRARDGAWLRTELAPLVAARDDAQWLALPVTDSVQLVGLLVAERAHGEEAFRDAETELLRESALALMPALREMRDYAEKSAALHLLIERGRAARLSHARLVMAPDAERSRVERDLHDGAQQHLIALAINLRLARELATTNRAEASRLIARLEQSAEDGLREMRRLVEGIYPRALVTHGIRTALEEVASRLAIKVHFESRGELRYSPDVEAAAYFCCAEALQNAAKHCPAGVAVYVTIRDDGRNLHVGVRDDGPGFETRWRSSGAGIAGLTERLELLGGELAIESAPGGGTSVSASIPLDRGGAA